MKKYIRKNKQKFSEQKCNLRGPYNLLKFLKKIEEGKFNQKCLYFNRKEENPQDKVNKKKTLPILKHDKDITNKKINI